MLPRHPPVHVVPVNGEDDDAGIGNETLDLPSRFEPVAIRHVEIHQHKGGMQLRRLVDGFHSIPRFTDDLDAGLGAEERRKRSTKSVVIVCDEDSFGCLGGGRYGVVIDESFFIVVMDRGK